MNALVTDIITPPIGLLTGKINFAELVLNLGGSVKIQYGLFIQACFTFVIIAFALFLMIRFMNRLTKKQKASKSPDAKSAELLVLEEIRDSLKK